jgi:hypothetical protein
VVERLQERLGEAPSSPEAHVLDTDRLWTALENEGWVARGGGSSPAEKVKAEELDIDGLYEAVMAAPPAPLAAAAEFNVAFLRGPPCAEALAALRRGTGAHCAAWNVREVARKAGAPQHHLYPSLDARSGMPSGKCAMSGEALEGADCVRLTGEAALALGLEEGSWVRVDGISEKHVYDLEQFVYS